MMEFFGIHFAGIDRLIMFPLFLFFIIVIFKNHYRLRNAARLLSSKLHRSLMLKNFSPRKKLIKAWLLSSSLLLIFFALLQPQWGKTEQTIEQEGRDLLILLDISKSMLAQDMKPSRLDFAKLKIRNLLPKLDYERIGLIVFSGSSFVQCPLTADHAAFLMFLQHVDTEIISSGTTALDTALKKALEVFASAQGRKNKLVLLMTDGEDYSLSLDSISKKAIREGLNLFALGIGTSEGAPIPQFDFRRNQIGHETDESGKIALSKLDERVLKKLTSDLGGHYVKATYDDRDLDSIARRVKEYEKEKFTDKKLSLFEEKYHWLLGAAWVLLALEWIL